MRLFISMSGAVVMVWVTIFLMGLMIESKNSTLRYSAEPIEFNGVADTDLVLKLRTLPQQRKPEPELAEKIEQFRLSQASETQAVSDVVELASSLTSTLPGETNMLMPRGVADSAGDADAFVSSRVEPLYPESARRTGKQGWVKLRYDINHLGVAVNIQVLDAQPKRTFDRSAISAISRWRFEPKREGGKPVSTLGEQVTLMFQLEDQS